MYCPPHDPLFLERVYCNPPNNDSVHHILVLRNQPLVCVQYSRVECFFSHFNSFVLSKEYWRTNLLGIFFLAFSYANAIKISKKKEKDEYVPSGLCLRFPHKWSKFGTFVHLDSMTYRNFHKSLEKCKKQILPFLYLKKILFVYDAQMLCICSFILPQY